MANEKSVAGYEIKVVGEYYSKDPNTGQKSIKQFGPLAFEFPEIVTYVEGRKSIEKIINGRSTKSSIPNVKQGNASRVGLHVIRRYYVEHVLKEDAEKYPGYTGIRKVEVFSKEAIKVAPPKKLTAKDIQKMPESELRQFILLNDINIVLAQYGDLGDKKNAVVAAYKQKLKDDKAAGLTPELSKDQADLLPADELFASAESGLGDLE